MSLLLAASAAGVGALSALTVRPLIRSIPEPASSSPEPAAPPVEPVETKEPYVAIAALRGVVLWSALAGALCGAIIGWSVEGIGELVMWLPLVPVGIALGLIDLRTKLLPARVVLAATAYVLLVGGLLAIVDREPGPLIRGLIGLVAARSLFWLFWRIYPRGMGFGDVRLAAVLGFVLAHAGWAEFGIGIYAAFPMLGVPGLVLAVVTWDRAQLRRAYPFGPAMLVGALMGLLIGEPLVSWLLRT